jgi:hypothetical protein
MSEQLHSAITTFETLDNSPTEEGNRQVILANFMEQTFEIGLQTRLNPSIKTQDDFARYVQVCCSLLENFMHRIQTYIDETTSMFDFAFEYDEWIIISRNRSAIEFLREFVSNTEFTAYAMSLDTLSLDDWLASSEEGYLEDTDIPAGVPTDHWWWWHPNPPRA